MHPKEFKKVKNNTGYLTHNSLKNSELFVGIDFSEHRRVNEIIEEYESYILFPSQGALNLSRAKPSRKKSVAIFLIDATWACAKKIFLESKNLQNLPHMSFDVTTESQYQIKEQPAKHCLSTIESTYEVIKLLNAHGIEKISKKQLHNFLLPFYEMVAYQKEKISNSSAYSPRFKGERKSI
jgi:DTW domain-containing protein YfiP